MQRGQGRWMEMTDDEFITIRVTVIGGKRQIDDFTVV